MKLFFVAQFVPYPPVEGSSIYVFHRVDRVRAHHEVTFFAPLRRPTDGDSLTFLRDRGWTIETLSKPPGIGVINILASRARAFFSPIPVHWALSWDRAIGSEMERQVRAHQPEVVVIEHLIMTRFLPYIRRATDAPIVFADHNVEALWGAQASRELGLTFSGLLARSQAGKVRRQEVAMLNRCDLAIAISEADRRELQRMAPSARIRVVPIGVDMDYFTPQPEVEEDDVLVWVGGLNIGTNLAGLRFLANEILPLIHRKRPEVRVEIVGRAPLPGILALAGPKVSVITDVPDVRPYMAKATVFVVPIKPQSGVRLKMLEGFAMARATVSTSLAAEGLDVVDGEHLLIRDDAQSFADATVELLSDKAKRDRLGAAGRALAKENYSWEAACAEFETHLAEMMNSVNRPQEADLGHG